MTVADPIAALPGIDAHPHARAVLAAGLPPQGDPSHAYLFHGPPGTGKRAIARAFAAALLADGARDPGRVAERIARGSHPDLTWVTPSGASEMLVSDIEEPVVAAATRTPFESSRRVFVIEAVDAMNDQAANRMLKTLEEPPAFVHLLLLTDRREDVLATIASRCQHVRFDPLPPARIAERLEGSEPERAQRVRAPGARRRAPGRAPGERRGRGAAEQRRAASCAPPSPARPTSARGWGCSRSRGPRRQPPARRRRSGWRASSSCCRARSASATNAKDWRRGAAVSGARARRRSISRCGWRSCGCATCCASAKGPRSSIHAVDRRAELEHDASAIAMARRLRKGIELVQDTRVSLPLNVSEELALEALAYRLESLPSRAEAIGPRLRLEAVGLEREEAGEQAVLGPVEVGGAGAEQAERGAALGQQLGLLAGVGHVEGLHPVDAERAEALDAREHLVGIGDVPEGVRPDGDAAGVVDRLDGLRDGGRLAQAEGRSALDQVGADERADVVDALVVRAWARWRGRRARPRRDGDGRSAGRAPVARRARVRRARGRARAARRPCAACAARGRRGTRRACSGELGVGVVDEVAEDVQFARRPRRRRRSPRSRPRGRRARRRRSPAASASETPLDRVVV